MKILITGGAGFIGSNLAGHHIDKADEVWVVDNLSSGTLKNIEHLVDKTTFRFSHDDILFWDHLDEAVQWADRIYHMAAIVGVKRVLEDPREVMAVNVSATERLFRAAATVTFPPQILLASTSEVYGFNPNKEFRETDDIVLQSGARLRWCYAVTKLTDEFLAYAYLKKSNVPVVIARLFNTIGPHQTGRYGWVVPSFIKQAVHDQPITVYGNGTQTRSFCDVRDTVVALDLLASNPEANGEIVNVGNDHEISILKLAELVRQLTGSNSEIHFISYEEAYGINFEDIFHRRPVIDKLFMLTGFRPKWELEASLHSLIKVERES
jgi:UDP-glucose 4-epimerase